MVELASQQPVSVKGPIKLIGWLAFLAALTTIPLISIGGAVTTYGAGMAVPDWPTTFGENMFLYNMFESSFGVIIEHSHRLFGSLVGLLALINCIVAWFGLGRSRLTTIITVALSLVIVQGLLGGFRVTLHALLGPQLAMVHGVFGQLTFAFLVWTWLQVRSAQMPAASPVSHELSSTLHGLSFALPVLLFVQVMLGAVHRHLPTMFGMTPSAILTFILHAAVGIVVLLVGMYLWAAVSLNRDLRSIVGRGPLLIVSLLLAQVLLGVLAAVATQLIPGRFRPSPTHLEAAVRNAHVVLGGLLLAGSVILRSNLLSRLASPAVESEVPANHASASGHSMKSAGVSA